MAATGIIFPFALLTGLRFAVDTSPHLSLADIPESRVGTILPQTPEEWEQFLNEKEKQQQQQQQQRARREEEEYEQDHSVQQRGNNSTYLLPYWRDFEF